MRFKAHVQYGDWKGTAAADNADKGAITTYMRNAGLLDESEFLVGFEFFVGETRANVAPYFSARAYVLQADGFENARDAVLAQNPLPVVTKDLQLDLASFFQLFKRFNVVLTHRGLDLRDKEYVET